MKEAAPYIDLIGKYLSGNIRPDERAELLRWAAESPENQAFLDEMIQLWSISGDYPESFAGEVDPAWQRLEVRINSGGSSSEETARIRPFFPRLGRWVAAASVLLLLAIGLWQLAPRKEMIVAQTQAGERLEVTLPDSSKVWLNGNTRLEYARNFRKNRNVRLSGEAFFDVQPDVEHPFVILSGVLEATVLGTSFNVRAYPGEKQIEVTVKTGQVRLHLIEPMAKSAPVRESVMVEAGKSAVFSVEGEQLQSLESGISNADSWKEQRLDFEATPMDEVITAMERYFGITLEVANPNILNCTLDGAFDQAKPDEIFQIFNITMGLDVSYEEGRYVIRGEGCPPNQ